MVGGAGSEGGVWVAGAMLGGGVMGGGVMGGGVMGGGGVHLWLRMYIRGACSSAEVELSRLIASSFQCKLAPVPAGGLADCRRCHPRQPGSPG